MFNCPSKKDSTPEGQTDENSITLPIDLKDFVALVGFFNRELCRFEESKEDWISVLKLSHRYMMERVHKSACKVLSTCDLDPFEKLELAEGYDIDFEWASDSLRLIFSLKKPITVQESLRLTHRLAAAVSYVREEKRYHLSQSCKVCGRNVDDLFYCKYCKKTALNIEEHARTILGDIRVALGEGSASEKA